MARTDYKEINYTIYHVTEEEIPDGTGGTETVYVVGNSFRGTCVKSPEQEQIIAGVRGDVSEQYNLTVLKNEPIERNDILMLQKRNGNQLFLRVKTEPQETPSSSMQADWKGFTASEFDIRDTRVVTNGAD